MNCSVLILTLNEAQNIEACIESARFVSDDIVVFDSHSTDSTVALAERAGARVFQRAFENYGAQREAARTTVDYRHEWVLTLDADERIEPDLRAELPGALASAPDTVAAFRLRRKDYFQGRWIKHASLYPSWHVRVYRHARIWYPDRSVHEYPDVKGDVAVLQGHLRHHNCSKGLAQWWQRHIRYAEMEAFEIRRHRATAKLDASALLSRDPLIQRRAMKQAFWLMPFRPEIRYAYLMLVRGALLDGSAGWQYARMIAEYQRIMDQLVEDREASVR